jgi:D-amino-acid dehydrogenase
VNKQRHVLVLGAGVIGVTTAYYLARSGCRVTIVDRADGAAAEGSHSNGGALSSFHAHSWANPTAPAKFLLSMFKRNSVFRIRMKNDPAFFLWAAQFLRYCLPGASQKANAELYDLVVETQSLLKEVLGHTGIDANLSQGGLYLIKSKKELSVAATQVKTNPRYSNVALLDQEALFLREPSMSRSLHQFAGALLVERDYSADCFEFTTSLLRYMQSEYDVSALLQTEVTGFLNSGRGIHGVQTTNGPCEADDVVTCLGAFTPLLTRSVGYKPPIYPVKGYSLSLPIVDSEAIPKRFALDETAFVAYARLGKTFRLATFVEFSGYDTTVDPMAIEHLSAYAAGIAPDAFDFSASKGHACLRPMSPDGSPIIGPVPGTSNLWINSGHGHKGWATSCASAKRLLRQMQTHWSRQKCMGVSPSC